MLPRPPTPAHPGARMTPRPRDPDGPVGRPAERLVCGSPATPTDAGRGALLGDPDFLGRPSPRPGGSGRVVEGVVLRVGRRLELDEVEDLEAARAEQAEPVPVPQVELDPPAV